jgi:hypothetical protein
MALPFQTTLKCATEADFDPLADVMFAAVREGESPYTEAQRQAWVPEPRRGSEWRTRLISQECVSKKLWSRLRLFPAFREMGDSQLWTQLRATASYGPTRLRSTPKNKPDLKAARFFTALASDHTFVARPKRNAQRRKKL